MQKLDTILVILDKPKHPQEALTRALALSRATGAHLHLASFCWLPMVTHTDVFDTHQRRAIKKSAMNERRRWLEGLVRDRGLSAADITTEVVWTNDIAEWVAEKSADRKVDLVVKTVHRSGTLLHTPLDWALLQTCQAPLLLAASGGAESCSNVLVTVDLNSRDARHRRLNNKVVEAAAQFAAWRGAKLHAVNVVEIDASFEDLDYFDTRKMRKLATDNAREGVADMLAGHDVAKRNVHLPSGKVGQSIAAVADDVDADVVVVGTGARRALSARLLGTSAEKILSHVDCDVLAIHV